MAYTVYRYCFHEVAALHALMHAARPLRENGDDIIYEILKIFDFLRIQIKA